MILVKSVHLQRTPWHTRLTFLMFPDQISIKRQNKGNQQESYRSWQSSEVCCGYVDPTQYICTSLSISSHQLLRAKRFEQEERNRARKKKCVSQPADNPAGCVPIFGFQEVLEFLQVRYERVGDIIMQRAHSAPSCSWFPAADYLLRHADRLRCDPADQHWYTSTDWSGLQRIKYVQSLQR